MPANKLPASQPALSGDGKRLRRARNIIRRYASLQNPPAKVARRLERARAFMVRAVLVKS